MQQYAWEPSSAKNYDSQLGTAWQPAKSTLNLGFRRAANVPAMLISLLGPWILFALVFAAVSFPLRCEQPWLSGLIVCCGGAVVAATGWLSYVAICKRWTGVSQRDPTWLCFWAVTSLIAFAVALMLGSVNFSNNTRAYCDTNSLTYYSSVDPTTATGNQLLDAGRVGFVEGSKIDVKRFMAFKNVDQYCVAPIVTAGKSNTSAYDLWAVGLNCCGTDFHCGEYNAPHAHAGLRLVRDDQAAFYRLAVQQAEAAYNVISPHPVFFYWMQDPIADLQIYLDDGVRYYVLGTVTFAVFQVCMVLLALIVFRKLGLD